MQTKKAIALILQSLIVFEKRYLDRMSTKTNGVPSYMTPHACTQDPRFSAISYFRKVSKLRWQKMMSPSNWPFKKKSLHLNDNTCFCSIIQSSKLVLGSLLAKNNFFVQFWKKKNCILPDGQLWEWLTGGVALPQPKCNWSVGFAIARWPVGKASDNARIMLSSLFRYSLV